MITPLDSKKRKKKGSIKKMEEAAIRKEVVAVDQNLTPFKGIISYHYCDNCGDGRVHRVQEGLKECISCGVKENLLIGEPEEEKILNDILIF